jgi:hypothetical protein
MTVAPLSRTIPWLGRTDKLHRARSLLSVRPLDESYQGVTFAEFLGEGQKPYVLRNLGTAFFCNLLICDSNYSDRLLGALGEMEALVERCMADYDEDGWRHPAYHDGSDISLVNKK